MTGPITLTSGSNASFDKTALSFVSQTGTEQVRIGTNSSNNLGIYSTGNIYLKPNSSFAANGPGVTLSSTEFTYNNYKIWHEGNDGDGSGLDADLLDGYHVSLASSPNTIPVRTSNGILSERSYGFDFYGASVTNGWYRVYTSLSSTNSGQSSVLIKIGKSYGNSQADNYVFYITITRLIVTITQISGNYSNAPHISKIRVNTETNNTKFSVDVLMNDIDTSESLRCTGFGDGVFQKATLVEEVTGYSVEFDIVRGCKSETYNIGDSTYLSGFTGNLEGNASTATKLQTARTIWGQSFDGTADVSGDFSLGGASILGSKGKNIFQQNANGLVIIGYNSAADGYSTAIFGNTVSFRYGTSRTDGMRLTSTGNIIIGTTTDSGYKLDVNGSTQIRDQFRLLSTDGVYEGVIQLYNSGELALHSTKIGVAYTNLIINRNGGNVGIGTANPTYKLDVNGTIHAYSNVRTDASIYTNNHLLAGGYVFLGNGGEGVYVTKNGVAWHDSSNSYVTSLLQFASDGSVNIPNKLKVSNIPIYKSQDDVLYIDGNLAVRGGITMYATDAIDVPSIIDALPIASASAKGIAAFNPSDFSVVDGYVSFIGKGGVDESVLADYAKKTDLSKYLPLSGGQMTGSIDYPLGYMGNIRDLASSCIFDYTDSLTANGVIDNKRSLMGYAHNVTYDSWWNIISVRGDSDKYGMYICSSMTEYGGSLSWNRQEGFEGVWQGERVILDSVNWRNYVTLGGNPTYDGMLTVNGSDSRGSYPALRMHIPNVNWQQFLMRGDGIVELRYGDGGQSGTWGQLALGAIFLDDQRDDVLYFPGKEYFDNHGNMHIPNADGSWSWNIFNSNGSSMMTVYTNGFTLLGGGLSVNAATGRPSLGYLSGGMLSVGLNGLYGTHIWTEGSGTGCIQVGRSDGSATSYLLALQPLGGETHICGSLLTYGGITMYSDIRKKTKLQDVELSLKQIADAPLIEHYYNSDVMRTTHVGSIAQYWAGLNDWFCKLDSEGYYTMEIQNAALASAISIARELVKYESKTDKEIRMLKDEVKRLKKEIKILKSA